MPRTGYPYCSVASAALCSYGMSDSGDDYPSVHLSEPLTIGLCPLVVSCGPS